MGMIANSMGAGLGQGLAQWASMMDRDQNSQAKLDLLTAQADAKLQATLAGIKSKYDVAAAKNSNPFDEEIAAAGGYGKVFNLDYAPTDKKKFTKSVTVDDESGGHDETQFDAKGHAAAEDSRRRKIERAMILRDKPEAYKSFSEGEAQTIANQVAEFALKNPKMSVAELADRLSLLKPGTERVKVEGDALVNKFGAGGEDGDGIIERGLSAASAKARAGGAAHVTTVKETQDGSLVAVMSDGSQRDLGGKSATQNKQIADIVLKKEKEDSKFAKLSVEEKRAYAANLLFGGGSTAGAGAPTIAPATRPPANAAGVRSVVQGVLGSR